MARLLNNCSRDKVKKSVADTRDCEDDEAFVVFVGPYDDCKFYSAWFAAVAELQKKMVTACKDKQCEKMLWTLTKWPREPNLERTAAALMMNSNRRFLGSVIFEIGRDDFYVVCLMRELRLFERREGYYFMTVPRSISVGCVRQAARTVAKVVESDDYDSTVFFKNMPWPEAIALQERLAWNYVESNTLPRGLIDDLESNP